MDPGLRSAVITLLAGALGAPSALAAPRTYVVVPAESRVHVHVGRAGLFGFAGHEHEVVGHAAAGEVVADEEDLARGAVWLEFLAAELKVSGEGEPAEDVPKVQAKMTGPEVLDAAQFPKVTFKSSAVAGKPAGAGSWDVQVNGDLTLHGVTRPVVLALRVARSGDALTASGRTTIRHTDFGMKPVSVAGVVKVKNELTLQFEITARAR